MSLAAKNYKTRLMSNNHQKISFKTFTTEIMTMPPSGYVRIDSVFCVCTCTSLIIIVCFPSLASPVSVVIHKRVIWLICQFNELYATPAALRVYTILYYCVLLCFNEQIDDNEAKCA